MTITPSQEDFWLLQRHPTVVEGGRKEVDGKKGIIPSETLNPSVILSLL